MIKIDNTLLQEVGLGTLPDAEKNAFLKHIYETLEMNVGVRLADQMSNEQLDEFEKYFEAKDDAGAFKWLETNFPNYKDIVQQEFDKLKSEVAQTAPQILAASQAQAAQNPTPAPAAQPQEAQIVPPQPQAQPVPAQYAQPTPQPEYPQPQQQPQVPASSPFDQQQAQQPYQPQTAQQPAAYPQATPLNDPYQPAQPAVGSSPAPAPAPAAPATDFSQPSAPAPQDLQPYQQPQPQHQPQAPASSPFEPQQAQQPYQPPFPQQQPPAGPQFPPQV